MSKTLTTVSSSRDKKSFSKQVIKLIRLRMASENWTAADKAILTYLEEEYNLMLTKPKLNKLMGKSPDQFNLFNKNYFDGFKKLYNSEPSKLKAEIYANTDFVSYINYNELSMTDMIESIILGKKCVYHNTYLDLDDMNSPLINLHLAIQKSTECIINNGADKEKLVNYRIMFLHLTSQELKDRLKTDNYFKSTFQISAQLHHALSINFGIICIDQLAEFIIDNIVFFDPWTLADLGLSGLTHIIRNWNDILDINEIIDALRNSIKSLETIPEGDNLGKSPHTYSGLDYLHIDNTSDTVEEDNIWIAFKDLQKQGLTFKSLNNEVGKNSYRSKKTFSNMLFEEMTETKKDFRKENEFRKIINSITFLNPTEEQIVFKKVYDAFEITNNL